MVVVEAPPVMSGHHGTNSLVVLILFLALFNDQIDGDTDKDDTGSNLNLYLQNRLRCQELPELWIAVPNCCFDHLDFQKNRDQFCSRNIDHSPLSKLFANSLISRLVLLHTQMR